MPLLLVLYFCGGENSGSKAYKKSRDENSLKNIEQHKKAMKTTDS